ncbi:MAG TPA: hypothetical protein VIN09_11450 [Chloroflexota bacterium]
MPAPSPLLLDGIIVARPAAGQGAALPSGARVAVRRRGEPSKGARGGRGAVEEAGKPPPLQDAGAATG